jgi:hypothetical protein
MKRIIVSLFVAASVAGCGSDPAPVEPAAEPAPAPAAAPQAAAPAAPAQPINGSACWQRLPTDTGPTSFLPDSPAGVVERFYGALQPNAAGGVPDDATLRQYAPMLTVALEAGLVRARAERDKAIAERPGEKPPYVEGALFSSLFEGYTQTRPLTVAVEGNTARVPTCFVYTDGNSRTEWTDTVLLRRDDGIWVIDDIAYGAPFGNSGSLRGQLPAEK